MSGVILASEGNVGLVSIAKQSIRRSFVVNLEQGLHARPCALLVKTLQAYSSDVLVECNGETASGKSILGLLTLGAGPGSVMTFTIEGEDALEAMAQVERLFSSRFEPPAAPVSSNKSV
ncbi:MAG TPA: HPr family phosphocarrier protein [Verrucomicrobiae bacterium]|nr:HPr family phosphocarrier protein [Verrucomicrobiae bacterium]